MRRFIPALSAAALVGGLTWTSVATAAPCGGPGGGPGMRGQHLERMLDDADLAPETEDKVRSILEEARRAHRPMREQIVEARKKVHELLGADEVDATAVIVQADEVGNLLAQTQRMRAATLLQVRSAVTADDWQELLQGLDDSFGGRRGPKGQGGRGPWTE